MGPHWLLHVGRVARLEQSPGVLRHGSCVERGSICIYPPFSSDSRIIEWGVRTSLRTAPRINECGAIDVKLRLAEPALARRATRIWSLLDRCFDGDVCVD